MSKSTKIIAGLGVAAALGVAALPVAGTFAADPSISGETDVKVTVKPAISMTIAGNDEPTTNYVNIYHDGTNAMDDGETNPVLGGTISATAPTANKASSVLTISPNAKIDDDTTFASTIKVWTNSVSGYNLALSGVADMESVENKATNNTKITPNATLTEGQNRWAFQITESAGVTDKEASSSDPLTGDWEAADNASIAKTTAKTADTGSESKVQYGVSTAANLEADTYGVTLTYTASVND